MQRGSRQQKIKDLRIHAVFLVLQRPISPMAIVWSIAIVQRLVHHVRRLVHKRSYNCVLRCITSARIDGLTASARFSWRTLSVIIESMIAEACRSQMQTRELQVCNLKSHAIQLACKKYRSKHKAVRSNPSRLRYLSFTMSAVASKAPRKASPLKARSSAVGCQKTLLP